MYKAVAYPSQPQNLKFEFDQSCSLKVQKQSNQ